MQHHFIEKQNILPKFFEWLFHNMQLPILLCRSLPFIVVTYVTFYRTLLKLNPLFEIVSKSYTYLEDILLVFSNINLNIFLF